MDLKLIAELADVCRKKGIKTIKVGDIEFTLGEKPEVKRKNDNTPDVPTPKPEDLDVVLWSANGVS